MCVWMKKTKRYIEVDKTEESKDTTRLGNFPSTRLQLKKQEKDLSKKYCMLQNLTPFLSDNKNFWFKISGFGVASDTEKRKKHTEGREEKGCGVVRDLAE